jgi:hypothetical protein
MPGTHNSHYIRTPDDLQHVLGLIQSKLTTGDLAEDTILKQAVGSFSQVPFSTLIADGPWPDVLQYFFHCTACGQSFRLEVETYHGAGGTWSPLN